MWAGARQSDTLKPTARSFRSETRSQSVPVLVEFNMVGTLMALTSMLILGVAGIGSYLFARGFVQRRLRFVDAMRAPFAPLLAGAAAFLVAWPLSALPLISLGTAIVFGVGTGMGTAAGVRALGRADSSRGRLYP
jgi:hypothetical protein